MASAVQRIGALRDRVRIERRADDDAGDGAGNYEGEWETLIETRRARIVPRKGGEQVIADRLTGVSSFDVWMRFDRISAQIRAGDRLVNCNDESRILRIRFAEAMDEPRRWLLLQCDEGVAT